MLVKESKERPLPESALRIPRPRRGAPEETRERLIAAAAKLFNRYGYHGADSNRIAKEAGYATGTFYKHFKDKRETFLAAYETWVSAEWKAVANTINGGGNAQAVATELVRLSIEFHTRWRGLRASLRELIVTDRKIRRFYRKQRRRQLDIMAEFRANKKIVERSREDDAIYLFTTERTFDAIAQGELEDLGLDRKTIVEAMIRKTVSMLT